MTTTIQREHIESALQSLPIQNRTMIQLLLLQYFDITQEEIDYMATDQPDSRFLSGNQPKGKTLSLEAVQNVEARANQYKGYYRQKRERPGMHVEFLKQTFYSCAENKMELSRSMSTKIGPSSVESIPLNWLKYPFPGSSMPAEQSNNFVNMPPPM